MPDSTHPAHLRVRDAAAKRGVAIEVVTFDESTHTAQEAADAIELVLADGPERAMERYNQRS